MAIAGRRRAGEALLMLSLLAGCDRHQDASPPPLSFGGLPVSGSRPDALRAGFQSCISNDTDMSCRKSNVMFEGHGPYNAAVDFARRDRSGGFDQLTLWHDTDQQAVYAVTNELKRQGWRECFSGARWGNQAVYSHDGSPVFVSMDLSYWLHRRLRVIPASKMEKPPC